GLAELVEVAAGAGPAVGRCVAVADVGVALDVLRAGERALVVLLAVAGGAETARAPRLPLVAAHVLLVVAREGGPGLVAHPAGLRRAAGLFRRTEPPPAAAPRRLGPAVAEAATTRLPVPAVLV